MSDFHTHTTAGDMHNHFVNGEHVSTSFKNVFGGHDVYDPHMHMKFQTRENIFGEHDVYKGGQLVGHELKHPGGGTDFYDKNMHYEGGVRPNAHHSHDVVGSDGHLMASGIHGIHGTTVLKYPDPLAHVQHYEMPKLIL
jgi:hypothetical protein